MKKLILTLSLVAAVVLILATASFVYAQNPNPSDQPFPAWMENMINQGRMLGRGGMMGSGVFGGNIGAMHNIMHDDMVAALAEKLDLSVEEINQRFADGETMWEIAEKAGLSQEDFTTWILETKKAGLEQAVADEVITQEQADWMLERMEQMQSSGFAPGSCHGSGAGPRYDTNTNTY